uniref:Uncharacterized protein n=1 Tax=Mycena chlorophos TaxID=658473 RepID=A0ABQ0L5I5_MYCCL|nr:predicted protein [Mycena chlorophos]
MAKRKLNQRASMGPSQQLIARVEYLGDLLKHLPNSLPQKPAYEPRLDLALGDIDEDRGMFGTASWVLEVAFKLHATGGKIKIQERGPHIQALIPFLKQVFHQLDKKDRQPWANAWLDRLLQAAKDAGAKMPSKARAKPPPTAPVMVASSSAATVPLRSRSSSPIAISDAESDEPPRKKLRASVLIISDDEMDDDTDSELPERVSLADAVAAKTARLAVHAQTQAAGPVSDTRTVSLSSNMQGSLLQFGFKKTWDSEEARQHFFSKARDRWVETRDDRLEEEAEKKEAAVERRRVLGAARSKKLRDRRKEEKAENVDAGGTSGQLVDDALMAGAAAVAAGPATVIDSAVVSRGGSRAKWCAEW